MPRSYQKKIGANYQNYDPSNLEKAVNAVRKGSMSLRDAAEQFGVPKTTISRKVNNLNTLKVGGQNALGEEDERFIADGLLKCAEWGFPLTTTDVRFLVRDYLNSRGVVERRFVDNTPGHDWALAFLQRRGDLSVRFCTNIKRARAAVTYEVIDDYFDHLHETLKDVPVSNIINYDETNFTDDPGVSRVIVRRGSKHPDRVCDSSKTSISVMMAAVADGTVLPPYVVYKAAHLYPTWIEGGVEGSAYNRNLSGWFDSATFADWFRVICLPFMRNLEGRKVMIGDNLLSHLNMDVIQSCAENNIEFVLLPPNSTHLCQPLDIAFFGPLKKGWRQTLTEWKSKNRGVLPKAQFPAALKSAIEKAGGLRSANVVAGFRAAGIFPFDPQQVLKRVPSLEPANEDEDRERSWTSTFEKHLARLRNPTEPAAKKPRGKKLQVPAGKSVTSTLREVEEEELLRSEDEDNPSIDEAPSDRDDDDIPPAKTSRNATNHVTEAPSTSFGSKSQAGLSALQEDDFVIVNLTSSAGVDKYYLGQILKVFPRQVFEIRFLRARKGKKQTFFVFPDIVDESAVDIDKIVMQVHPTQQRRGSFTCASLNDMKIE